MSDFLLATWNVNSLRARLEHVERFLLEWRPDVLMLQETKVVDADFPAALFEGLGYHLSIWGQKTYNGVALASLHPLEAVRRGLADVPEEVQEARVLAATVRGLRVVNVYIPNGGDPTTARFPDKLAFFGRLRRRLEQDQHLHSPALVLAGDFNVAPEPRDVYDPQSLLGTTCYHPDEHQALEGLRSWGFTDAFRHLEPNAGLYSWWDYRQGAWPKNHGLRIDHIWITPPLIGSLKRCWIEREERGRDKASDHAPVMAEFHLP